MARSSSVRWGLSRLGLMFLVVSSMGALPAGSCAKACGSGGRAASRGGSRAAHAGLRSGDDLARLRIDPHSLPRRGMSTGPLSGPAPIGVPLGHGLGGAADDVVHPALAQLDEAATKVPEVTGSTSKLAGTPSSRGTRMIDRGDGRSFARDYGRSIDRIRISPRQHGQLLDVLDAIQLVAETALEQLVEEGGDDGGVGHEGDRRGGQTGGGSISMKVVAGQLDSQLLTILSADQRAQFQAMLGSSEVIVYRLARERPIRGRVGGRPLGE